MMFLFLSSLSLSLYVQLVSSFGSFTFLVFKLAPHFKMYTHFVFNPYYTLTHHTYIRNGQQKVNTIDVYCQ